MISIKPTTASGLSHSTYSVDLPSGDGLNLKALRPQQVATVLDGSAVITSWAKQVSGLQSQVTVILTEAKYSVLRLIDEHASVFLWVIQTQGRTFTGSVDVVEALPVVRFGQPYWSVTIQFSISSELHR